jgi:hypothetical protein
MTIYTTTWRTETSVINAAQTTTGRTTITRGQGTVVGSGGGSGDVGTQSIPSQDGPKKGLSKGAQVGIGAGTAGGSLIICIILSFICRRRRKTRKERNQEMIDNAVTTAIAAGAQQNRVSEPPNRYSDGKHISTASGSIPSPHPYSPTPPLHTPQQPYVYPLPRDHTPQLYNNHAIPESSVDSQSHHSFGPPRYEGSEVGGTPIQRYELQQFTSPALMHANPHGSVPHPGAYPTYVQQNRDRIQRGYSDLPEVTASDLPEVRASDLPEVHHR